jgi:hypothetical protein
MQDFCNEYSSNYENKRLIEVTDKTYSIVNDGLPIAKPLKSIEGEILKPIEVSMESEEMNIYPPAENEVDNSDSLQLGEIEVTDLIPNITMTEEKVKWINKVTKSNFSKDDMKLLTQHELNYGLYGNKGIWKIDAENSENRFLIRILHKGGNACKLINYNTENEFLRIDYQDLYHLLDKREIGFGEVTSELYYHIKNNGLEKRPQKETAA